ncbi:MAG: hypothetical protein C0622_04595 [Desulfuromonas sp.]|nr:MAG: hypothetical protein C0622_04595 [Desulfuromonas sp.]
MPDNKENIIINKLLPLLGDLARTDTLYHDIYRERAAHYLEQELPRGRYQSLKERRTRLASLPNQIRNAIMHNDWSQVHDLSARFSNDQELLKENSELMEYARKIYDSSEIPIDPFSPGMNRMAGYTAKQLDTLRKKTCDRLTQLTQIDAEKQAFYRQRHDSFANLAISATETDSGTRSVPKNVLAEEAEEALESGNMALVESLAQRIIQLGEGREKTTTPSELYTDRHRLPTDLNVEFADNVLNQADQYGLHHYQVSSQADEYAPFNRFTWHPTYSDGHNDHPSVIQVPDIPFPQDFPEALKGRIQLFAMHPFINSAGIRYLPTMLAEDVLVEDFPDPESESEIPRSKLLEALGLVRRTCLSRAQIEEALALKGNRVLSETLGLDPHVFKLVCIPPDLHLRIGQKLGWGQQKIWTHFDGYMIMADSSRRALAGGDVRYGGIYDLLGLSTNYDSERIITRFAVVQRRRLTSWN